MSITNICLATLLFLFATCKKKPNNEEPQLPPETQTGAMTFGCKVNGEVFVPKDGRGRPGLYVQYVNLGNGPGGGWFLNIPAVDQESDGRTTVNLLTDSLFLMQGGIYVMKEKKGFAIARFSNDSGRYEMLSSDSGELIITIHDQNKRVLAGRFWFNATSLSTPTKINITDGRFDIRY